MARKSGSPGGEVRKPKRTRDKEKAEAEGVYDEAVKLKCEPVNAAEPANEAEAEAAPPEIPGFDAKHLTGQLGDFLLEQVKHARHLKPWDQLDEFEQKRLISHCYETARGAVINAAVAIAGKGFKSAPMVLDQATLKDGVKITLSCSDMQDDAFLALKNNQGRLVQLVFADASDFAGEMLAKPEPNQPDLIAGGGNGAASEDPKTDEEEDQIDPKTGEIITPPATDPAPEQPAA